jgi:hypothetical protein
MGGALPSANREDVEEHADGRLKSLDEATSEEFGEDEGVMVPHLGFAAIPGFEVLELEGEDLLTLAPEGVDDEGEWGTDEDDDIFLKPTPTNASDDFFVLGEVRTPELERCMNREMPETGEGDDGYVCCSLLRANSMEGVDPQPGLATGW